MTLLHLHTPRGSRLSRPRIISTIALVLFACSFARTQEPEDVVRVRTDLVSVPLVVTDGHGRRVSGLKAGDFTLLDNTQVEKVDYFASGTDRVALLFALDASGSAREIVTQQREAAVALFARFGKGSRVAVLQFGESLRLAAGFTSDAATIEASFNLPAQATSGTAIFDAAAVAVGSFDGGSSMERRIVLLMSDGLDTRSSTPYRTVIERARVRGISFYVIHFPIFSPSEGRLEPRRPAKGFRELAEQTGGRYFMIGNAKSALDPHPHYDLTPVFQAIENDLAAQYVVGFYPSVSARDGQTHTVTVSLPRMSRKLRVSQLRATYSLKP